MCYFIWLTNSSTPISSSSPTPFKWWYSSFKWWYSSSSFQWRFPPTPRKWCPWNPPNWRIITSSPASKWGAWWSSPVCHVNLLLLLALTTLHLQRPHFIYVSFYFVAMWHTNVSFLWSVLALLLLFDFCCILLFLFLLEKRLCLDIKEKGVILYWIFIFLALKINSIWQKYRKPKNLLLLLIIVTQSCSPNGHYNCGILICIAEKKQQLGFNPDGGAIITRKSTGKPRNQLWLSRKWSEDIKPGKSSRNWRMKTDGVWIYPKLPLPGLLVYVILLEIFFYYNFFISIFIFNSLLF